MAMANNLLGGFGAGFNSGQSAANDIADSRRRNQLSSLASQAYSTPEDQRGSLLGQMAAIDPNSAQAQGEAFESEDVRKVKKFENMARLLTSAPEQYREGIYQRMRPSFSGMGASDIPDHYTPEMGQMAEKFLAARSGNGGQEQYTLSPGAARYDASGNLVAERPFAPLRPNYVWTDKGYMAVTGTEAAPVEYGGQPSAPQGQPTMTQVRYATSDGQPIPDNEQAALQAAMAADARGESFDFPVGGPLPQAPQGGGNRVMPAPKAGGAQFVQLNSDEIAAMNLPAGTVAQRNLTTGAVDIINKPPASAGAKPMPVSALKLLQDSREKLSIAQGNIQSLSNIGQQIANGQLDLGLIANNVNRAKNFAGASTPESKNFALMMSSLEKLRNDSLRLNNGVQTEGDAQRAWNELMNNLNDEKVVEAQIVRIIGLNRRAELLHQENVEGINANYGAGKQAGQEQEAANDIDSLLEMY